MSLEALSFRVPSLISWSSFPQPLEFFTLVVLWISFTFLLEFVHLELFTLVLWISFTFLLEFVHLCRSSLYTRPLDFVHFSLRVRSLGAPQLHSSFGFRSFFSWSLFTCAGAPYTLVLWISFTFLLEFVHLELFTLVLWILFTFLLEFVHLCRSYLYTRPLDFVHFSLGVRSLGAPQLHSSFGFCSFFSWSLFTCAGAPYTLVLWILFTFLLEFIHLELLNYTRPLDFAHFSLGVCSLVQELLTLVLWISFTFSQSSFIYTQGAPYAHPLELIHLFLGASYTLIP